MKTEKCLSCGAPLVKYRLEAPYLCIECAGLAVRQTGASEMKISRSGELTIIPPRVNFNIRGLPWV